MIINKTTLCPSLNKYHFITLFAISVVLFSCEPPVYFLAPQPPGVKNLPEIPPAYRADYLNTKDSIRIIISANMVTQYETEFSGMTREQLYRDIDTVIDHDTLVYVSPNWTVEINLIGDSAEYISRKVDTVFLNAPGNMIRKWQGFIFLNMKAEKDMWQVYIMKKNTNQLYFDELLDSSEIDSVNHIVEITHVIDSVENKIIEYYLDPSKKELSRILKKKKITFNFLRQ